MEKGTGYCDIHDEFYITYADGETYGACPSCQYGTDGLELAEQLAAQQARADQLEAALRGILDFVYYGTPIYVIDDFSFGPSGVACIPCGQGGICLSDITHADGCPVAAALALLDGDDV